MTTVVTMFGSRGMAWVGSALLCVMVCLTGCGTGNGRGGSRDALAGGSDGTTEDAEAPPVGSTGGQDDAAGTGIRAAVKLRLLRRWAILRESEDMTGVSDNAVFAMVADAAREADPDLRVSTRSLRRWRDQYNAIGPDGLAAGPAALFPRYTTPPRQGRC